MIGIDVVDLNDPLFKKRTARSLRLISGSDDQIIDHPHLFWLLWAAKEAVFKTYRTDQPFSPRNIPIKLWMEKGTFHFKSGKIEGQLILHNQYVLAIAGEAFSAIDFCCYEEKTANWSSTIRSKFKNHFSAISTDLKVEKDAQGLPIFTKDRLPISITHHGNFGAFAYHKTALENIL